MMDENNAGQTTLLDIIEGLLSDCTALRYMWPLRDGGCAMGDARPFLEAARKGLEAEAMQKMRVLEDEVVRAACGVVAADTYKHPILSREDAVAKGVAGLYHAVAAYQSAQPCMTSKETP